MTRVLSVIHSPFFGGPHNQVLRLAEPLRRRGFTSLAVVPEEPGNAFERLRAGGVEVVQVPLGRVRARLDWKVQRDSMRAIVSDVPRLRSLIRREEIELVVLHGSVNLQGAVAARTCGKPVVVQVLERMPRPLALALAPALRGLASVVMTTGREVARTHPGVPRDESRVYPFFPPVDTRLFSPNADERAATRRQLGFEADDVVIGCVANLTPPKGLETFVEAAERLAAAHERTRFAIFGCRMETHEDYAQMLERRASALIDARRLVIIDVGPAVARHVRALDVFLATARSEGISTTILEAMSSGIPIVSTDVGAIREAMLHGVTGFLAPPADVGELRRYVSRLVDDPSERASMGSSARERATRLFDVETCADVHARAFRAALARGAR